MSLLSLLNTFTEQAPLFLIVITAYVISAIIIRISKKEVSKISNFIINGIVRLLIVSTIPMLIAIYSSMIAINNITNIHIFGTVNSLSSLSVIFSLGISIILGIAILFMESERFVSPLIVENVNINNLGKIAIKLLDIVPFILSIILIYSILFLAIYPTSMVLIDTILSISQLYLFIIVFDVIFSIIAFTLNNVSKLTNGANYKDLLRNK